MTHLTLQARVAAVTLAIGIAASAMAHGVTCLSPQCIVAGVIMQALTPTR